MVELVDSEDLGSSAERRVGSSPTTRTKMRQVMQDLPHFLRKIYKQILFVNAHYIDNF